MSGCAVFRASLLEAEPAELRGEGDTAVAVHVRSCRACAVVAALFTDADDALDAHLRPAPDPAAVEAALRRAGTPPATGRRRGLRRSASWIPLAAAAAIGAVLLSRGPEVPPRPAVPSAPPPTHPVVRPEADGTVAVLQTDNPDITVLWFF